MSKDKAPFELLYQDDDILVVYKKRDVLTIKTEDKNTYHKNLYYYLKKDFMKKNEDLYVLHRLDFETSGILVFVKKLEVFKILQTAFKNRDVKRYYEAVVKEKIELNKQVEVHQNLKEVGEKVIVDNDGKEAITIFKATNYIQIGTALDIEIKTGRRNQIRIALNSSNLTLLGDKRYSNSIEKRMYLNEYKIEFPEYCYLKKSSFEVKPLWIIK